MLPGVLAGCDAAGITPGQLDGLVVVHGPGSFTGLRVAVTIANMLALTHPDIPLFAVTGGQVLAHLDGYSAQRYVFAPYASDVFLFDTEGALLDRQPGVEWKPREGDAGEVIPLLAQVRSVDMAQLENATVLMGLMEHLTRVEGQMLPFYAKDANITTPKNHVPGSQLPLDPAPSK